MYAMTSFRIVMALAMGLAAGCGGSSGPPPTAAPVDNDLAPPTGSPILHVKGTITITGSMPTPLGPIDC